MRKFIDLQRQSFQRTAAMAERELGAFLCTVKESYGSRQAALAAEDWLAELESVDDVAGFDCNDWRQITVAAAGRLAERLQAAHTKVATDTFVQ